MVIISAFCAACGSAKFAGQGGIASGSMCEKTVDQPTDASERLWLSCLPEDNASDKLKMDVSCAFVNAAGQKFQESPDRKLDFVKMEIDGQPVTPTMLLAGAPQLASPSSDFKFTVLKLDAARVILTSQFSNPQDQNKTPVKYSKRLPITVAPVFSERSKDFNAPFKTEIKIHPLMPDSKFEKILYSSDDKTVLDCCASAPIYRGEIDIQETVTLKALYCDVTNIASPVASVTYTYDNTAPTVAIASNPGAGPTNNSAILLTFTFSEAVTGFIASDVVLTNATAGTFTARSSTVYTLAITARSTSVTANVAANMANDTAGNGNTVATQWSILYDNSAPTVAITSTPASGPTNNAAMTLTFTFSDAVTGFDATDVSVTNATKGTFTPTNSTVYTLAITATGTVVTANVAANAAKNAAGNGNTAGGPWSMTYIPASTNKYTKVNPAPIVLKDNTSITPAIFWTNADPSNPPMNWEDAVILCASARGIGEFSKSWRLPTADQLRDARLKDILSAEVYLFIASVDGVVRHELSNWLGPQPPNIFWSKDVNGQNAKAVSLENGSAIEANKLTSLYKVICISN